MPRALWPLAEVTGILLHKRESILKRTRGLGCLRKLSYWQMPHVQRFPPAFKLLRPHQTVIGDRRTKNLLVDEEVRKHRYLQELLRQYDVKISNMVRCSRSITY
jgi:hypothetical protein